MKRLGKQFSFMNQKAKPMAYFIKKTKTSEGGREGDSSTTGNKNPSNHGRKKKGVNLMFEF